MGEIMKQSKMHLSTLPTSYVVVDTETTGLDPETCELVEVSALKVVDLVPVDSYSTLVACDHVNADAMRVNGITAKMLEGAPSAQEAVDGLVEFCGDLPLMAHNAKFDRDFIERVRQVPNAWVDTMQLASVVVHGKRTLSALCDRYGVENDEAHRALSDCKATHECYLGMRDELASTSTDARDIIADPSKADSFHPLHDKTVVFTGDTVPSSRHLAMQAVADVGGTPANGVTLKTDYLVTLSEYDEATGKVKKAKEYASRDGSKIRIIGKDEFCSLLGGDAGEAIAKRSPDVEKPDYGTHEGRKRLASSSSAEKSPDDKSDARPSKHHAIPRIVLAAFFLLCALTGFGRFELSVVWFMVEAFFVALAVLCVWPLIKNRSK